MRSGKRVLVTRREQQFLQATLRHCSREHTHVICTVSTARESGRRFTTGSFHKKSETADINTYTNQAHISRVFRLVSIRQTWMEDATLCGAPILFCVSHREASRSHFFVVRRQVYAVPSQSRICAFRGRTGAGEARSQRLGAARSPHIGGPCSPAEGIPAAGESYCFAEGRYCRYCSLDACRRPAPYSGPAAKRTMRPTSPNCCFGAELTLVNEREEDASSHPKLLLRRSTQPRSLLHVL